MDVGNTLIIADADAFPYINTIPFIRRGIVEIHDLGSAAVLGGFAAL